MHQVSVERGAGPTNMTYGGRGLARYEMVTLVRCGAGRKLENDEGDKKH